MSITPSTNDRVNWLRCNKCGWEHRMSAMTNQCVDCGTHGSLHIISNVDGELPKRLTLEQIATRMST